MRNDCRYLGSRTVGVGEDVPIPNLEVVARSSSSSHVMSNSNTPYPNYIESTSKSHTL